MDRIKVFLAFGSICCVVIAHPQPYNDNISGSKSKTCASMVSAFPPDPNTECCGLMNEDLVRITSGKLTINPHQYPWLALIEYSKVGVMTTLCNGALISGKYVLTAAQCVTGFTLHGAEPKNIILGEFDTLHKADDCIAAKDESKECTDGVTRIPIEKTIPHPDYDAEHEDRKSDIALIRMTQIAPYTDFIRPICLPSEDRTLQTGFIYLKKTSWVLSDGGKKKQVTLPFISQNECQSSLNSLKLKIWKDQICIGGQRKENSCGSDDGAPLVYENERLYEAIGIVSSSKGCLWNIPTTYTKVYEYFAWIKSSITA